LSLQVSFVGLYCKCPLVAIGLGPSQREPLIIADHFGAWHSLLYTHQHQPAHPVLLLTRPHEQPQRCVAIVTVVKAANADLLYILQ